MIEIKKCAEQDVLDDFSKLISDKSYE